MDDCWVGEAKRYQFQCKSLSRRGKLARNPIGVLRKEPIDEPHLIDNEKTEGQTYQSGDQSQAAIEANEMFFSICKWYGNRCGDQHHPRDGANPEYQQIADRPGGNTDGREHQQGYGRRSCKTVNDAHGQRPRDLIETQPAKRAIHPTHGGILDMAVFRRTVTVRMTVNVLTVSVWV